MSDVVVQPQTLYPSELGLKDVLDILKKEINIETNCHHVGVIQEFDEINQTAIIQIAYKRTILVLNTVTSQYEPTLLDYPLLLDVPVICLGGGGSSGGALTFPIGKGDECLVLFNDRAIDTWWSSGTLNAPPPVNRFHYITDGVALVGLRSQPNALSAYDINRATLKCKEGRVTINKNNSKIGIANNVTSLLIELQNLIGAVGSLVGQVGALNTATANSPAIAAALVTINSTLSTITGDLGGLLE